MKGVFARNMIFGVEDGLVSTVGFLSGIASAGVSIKTILLTGIVLIFVEAFSMAVGSLLSEHGGEEVTANKETSLFRSTGYALVMFISYFAAGLLSLLPYVFFLGILSVWISILVTLIALFLLGVAMARLAHIPALKQGLQMMIIGGAAVTVGMVVGNLFKGV